MKMTNVNEEVGKYIVRVLAEYGCLPDNNYSKANKYLIYLFDSMVRADDYKSVKMNECITQLAVEFDVTYNAIYNSILRSCSKAVTPDILFKCVKRELFWHFKDRFDDMKTWSEMNVMYAMGVWF